MVGINNNEKSNSDDGNFELPTKDERRERLLKILSDYDTAAITVTEATIAIIAGKDSLKTYSTTNESIPDELSNKTETIRTDLQELVDELDDVKREQTPGADKYSMKPVKKYSSLGKLEHYMYIDRAGGGTIDQIYEFLAVASVFSFPIFLYLVIDTFVLIDTTTRNVMTALIAIMIGSTLLLREVYINNRI